MLQSNWLSYNTLSAHARATFSEGLFGLAVEANFESRFAGNLPGGLRLRNYKFSWRLSGFACFCGGQSNISSNLCVCVLFAGC